ncbi:ABC transporter ATP-binding protein [Dermabacteraceae bacterium P13264]
MIEFKNVTKSFGRTPVLTGLSFEARNGRVTGFVGPNGAGKSTALKILSGILTADSGLALCDGAPFRASPQNTMGTFLGADSLPEGMRASDYLTYVCTMKDAPQSDGQRYLAAVGLSHAAQIPIGEFSLGMRQRIGLATALIGDPKNLVLDEPVNGLDVEGVRWLRGFLRLVASEGRAVLLSSHLLSELELVADDIVILADGRISRSGELRELKHSSEEEYLVVTREADILARALTERGLSFAQHTEGLVVKNADFRTVAQLVLDLHIDAEEISRMEKRIEDLYFEETAKTHPEASKEA